MKSSLQIILFLSLLALAGCTNSEQAQQEKTNKSVTASEVKDQLKEAATTTKAYVVENKDEFVATMDKQLKALDAKISELAKKSGEYKDDAKVQADKMLATLREQRDAVQTQFEKVKQSSSNAWTEVKAGFSSAMAELEKSYENVKAKFN